MHKQGRRLFIGSSTDRHCFNIGFIDSGIGGLSILAEVSRDYPTQNYTYLADQEFFPYGDKPADELLMRLRSLVPQFVQGHSIDLLVIACNTASTGALAVMRELIKIPIIGVVPAIKPAAMESKQKRVGILATPATTESSYTRTLIKEHAKDCEVHLIGSSKMVQLAEAKALGGYIDRQLVSEILEPFHKFQVDTVVLACTHFPFLRKELAESLPTNVKLIDSAKGISRQVGRILSQLTHKNQVTTCKTKLLSTDDNVSSQKLQLALQSFLSQ